MSYPAARSPDGIRHAITVARALTLAVRASKFYPPEHPALVSSLEKLAVAVETATQDGPLLVAVTPQALVVDGTPLETSDVIVGECARLLHDVDIMQLSFARAAPIDALRSLLKTLNLDREELRRHGGPQKLWQTDGHPSITFEQIDYQQLLEREGAAAEPGTRDVVWTSIINSFAGGRGMLTEGEQARLLDVSREANAIAELASQCAGAVSPHAGSSLLTTQAATVLAVYSHIASTVDVMSPEQSADMMGRLAEATCELEPALAMEILQMPGTLGEQQGIVAALRQNLEEQQIALLLARALAATGDATSRLSQMLETMTPDPERRRRVLRMADTMLSERDFGSERPLSDIRHSLEELLLKCDESPYVSDAYSESMKVANKRAAALAARDVPAELTDWLQTLEADSIRQISGQLLLDLLTLETTPEQTVHLLRDIGTFTHDLLIAGAHAEARRMIERLTGLAQRPDLVSAVRNATAEIARGLSREVAALGDADDEHADRIRDLAVAIGPAVVPTLLSALDSESRGTRAARAIEAIILIGPAAIPPLTEHLQGRSWWFERDIAEILGAIGTAAAVPPLQMLMRRRDKRVTKEVIHSLVGIADPSAEDALASVFRSGSGEERAAVIEALVELQDPRVVSILTQILDGSDPLGADFELVLDALGAASAVHDDRAVASISTIARRRKLLDWRRTQQLRERAVSALVRMGTTKAMGELGVLQRTGDWHLRWLARRAQAR